VAGIIFVPAKKAQDVRWGKVVPTVTYTLGVVSLTLFLKTYLKLNKPSERSPLKVVSSCYHPPIECDPEVTML
jgi:hypothetical protein